MKISIGFFGITLTLQLFWFDEWDKEIRIAIVNFERK